MKFTEVQRRLESAGSNIVSQKGSHAKFALKKGGAIRTAVIPKHKEITVGTLKAFYAKLEYPGMILKNHEIR